MKRHGQYYIYIVECANGTYYSGYTSDIQRRVERHNNGHGAKYLRGRLPVKLVFSREYRYYKNALKGELGLKKLTRQEKKELIKCYKGKSGSRLL